MTASEFMEQVIQPNLAATFDQPDDMRAIINAILTLDALVGIIHSEKRAANDPATAALARDDQYRETLAGISPSFRVLRDAAATLKHGALTDPRRNGLARLLRSSADFQIAPNGIGLFEAGDSLGSDVIVIEIGGGPSFVRATSVIADTARMLSRIVKGGAPRTDEHDRTTFVPFN